MIDMDEREPYPAQPPGTREEPREDAVKDFKKLEALLAKTPAKRELEVLYIQNTNLRKENAYLQNKLQNYEKIKKEMHIETSISYIGILISSIGGYIASSRKPLLSITPEYTYYIGLTAIVVSFLFVILRGFLCEALWRFRRWLTKEPERNFPEFYIE
jgi:hypothetical protein